LPTSDPRNFNVQAAIHGTSCRHGSELFLPWHRAYLYEFERLLQEQVPGVTLPYWDWVNTREVPEPYRDAVVADFNPNPLFNATRMPPPDGSSLPTSTDESNALALPNWPDFGGMPVTSAMAGAVEASNHNTVHGWVGGAVSGVPTAGLDPLFWALHSNVDRIWALWQTTHAGVPSDLTAVLDPFGMTVGETLSVRALGYDYAGLDSSTVMDSTLGCANYCSPPRDLPDYIIERGCRKAWVCIYGIVHPEDSYRIRVYLNRPNADSGTGTTADCGYCGHVSTFGWGKHMPMPQRMHDHCLTGYGRRPSGHDIPYNTRVDCTEIVNRICRDYRGTKAKHGKPTIQIKLVSVDRYGKQMPDDALQCRQIALEVTE
jgi:tyrosinase